MGQEKSTQSIKHQSEQDQAISKHGAHSLHADVSLGHSCLSIQPPRGAREGISEEKLLESTEEPFLPHSVSFLSQDQTILVLAILRPALNTQFTRMHLGANTSFEARSKA